MFGKLVQTGTLLFVLCSIQVNLIKPPIRLRSPVHIIAGDHISLEFYTALESADCAKNDLKALLHNFMENLQRNLSTSSILNTLMAESIDLETNQYQLKKLNDLADYFEHSANYAGKFAKKSETFFQKAKNESHSLLLKLRKVPTPQGVLPTAVKMHLTDYFAEMEFFHVMFSEIIDQALEYIVDTMVSIERIFLRYADIQRDILRTWNFESDERCYNSYMDFLQLWSAQIFKCSTSKDLEVAYDVYATTETITKHIMRELEFRIQRLYNCFIFGSYKIRCRFLRRSENDFEKLFAKLDELQQYYDIKIKKGRVTINRFERRRRSHNDLNQTNKCIPPGFPNSQMMTSINYCQIKVNS